VFNPFLANGTNGIFRDISKKFGTGQTGFGTIEKNSGRDKRDRDNSKKFRDGTNGIRDTKKSVPQDSTQEMSGAPNFIEFIRNFLKIFFSERCMSIIWSTIGFAQAPRRAFHLHKQSR
jgi:hypothetical protein